MSRAAPRAASDPSAKPIRTGGPRDARRAPAPPPRMAMMADRPLVPAVLARGARGAVVAPHHLATAAGLSVLRAGGHAVDAAIATNAVLSVVAPSSCGIGGDAFWLIWDEQRGVQLALNGSGR